MPDAPVPDLMASVARRAINVFQTILVGLTDEAGVPWTFVGPTDAVTNPPGVSMRYRYSDEDKRYPEIVVSVALGPSDAGMALGRIDTDDIPWNGSTPTGAPVYGAYRRNSSIILTVRALSDAERTYLYDALDSALDFGFWTNPATGRVVDQVMRRWLAEVGIDYIGTDKPDFPPARMDESRPEGQVYEAALVVRCNVWTVTLGGQQPTIALPTVQVYSTTSDGVTLPSNPTTITVAP